MDLLLIDDDQQIHHIVESFFDRFSKENRITMNFKSIIDPVQGLMELSRIGDNFDIIILDVRMPMLPGDNIYDYLVHEKPDMLAHVLFVTGYRKDLETRFPKQKLNILDKPFRYEKFAEALSNISN